MSLIGQAILAAPGMFRQRVCNNNKAKEIKASEENAFVSGSGEAINSSSNGTVEVLQPGVPKLKPSSQELATKFCLHSTICGSIHRPTPQQPEITYNTIMRCIQDKQNRKYNLETGCY
ncbi:790_t:CDS:2 [Diversispora eburnea]|uniref:790_t:CDS:1 n=1 Tax=Diversispora eburnea TaxID=1213867 RepID=A0A9N9F0F2_9GLOM|nr:790_t:CDS:2 [Diversispora eburnea]